MRIVVQRVSGARVHFEDGSTPPIGQGLLGLVGFHRDDSGSLLEPMARKLVHLRIFGDEDGRMNRSLLDIGGDLALISQFTLYGDSRKGRRPSFVAALEPGRASGMFDDFVAICRRLAGEVITGRFGAQMEVELVNTGPVTILLDSRELNLPSGADA